MGYTFRYLKNFAKKCKLCFDSHLTQINLSQADREEKQRQAKERLKALKRDNDTFFEDQQKILKSDVSHIAQNLKKFIKQPENLKRICRYDSNCLNVRIELLRQEKYICKQNKHRSDCS